jgi:hypothetical protein
MIGSWLFSKTVRASPSFGFFCYQYNQQDRKTAIFENFSLLPIQHRRGRRVLTFCKTFSFFFSLLLRRAGTVLLVSAQNMNNS